MLNNFVNLPKNGTVQHNLQPSSIKQDLTDVQYATDLLKFTFENLVE